MRGVMSVSGSEVNTDEKAFRGACRETRLEASEEAEDSSVWPNH